MSRTELKSAWTAVQLAVENIIVDNRMRPKTLQRRAEAFGTYITTEADIAAVLECVDVKKLLELLKD